MTREECLKKAQECVCGQREQDYGTPESNFGLIANLWSGYLGQDIKPQDVAMMMALLKMIARIKNGGGTGDSFVDLAGYAACGAEIFGGKDKEAESYHECITCKNCKYLYQLRSGSTGIVCDSCKNCSNWREHD